MINWGIIGLVNMTNTFDESIKELNDCKIKEIIELSLEWRKKLY